MSTFLKRCYYHTCKHHDKGFYTGHFYRCQMRCNSIASHTLGKVRGVIQLYGKYHNIKINIKIKVGVWGLIELFCTRGMLRMLTPFLFIHSTCIFRHVTYMQQNFMYMYIKQSYTRYRTLNVSMVVYFCCIVQHTFPEKC